MFRIRKVAPTDTAALAVLSGELGYPSSEQDLIARLERIQSLPGNEVFVAEDAEGNPLGWAHVFAAYRLESTPFAELGGLVVSQSAMGKGIGRALVEAAETWAQETGLTSIRVRSNVTRVEAHQFYEHLGYTKTKTQGVFQKP